MHQQASWQQGVSCCPKGLVAQPVRQLKREQVIAVLLSAYWAIATRLVQIYWVGRRVLLTR